MEKERPAKSEKVRSALILAEELKKAFQKLDEAFSKVPVDISRSAHLEGGVSACDIAAYQIGWGKLLLSWEEAEKLGCIAEMPAPGYKWNQLGPLARSFYSTYQDYPLSKLRIEYAKVVDEILALISNLTDEELFDIKKRRWTGEKWPMAKWIRVNTIAPYTSALKKLRKL